MNAQNALPASSPEAENSVEGITQERVFLSPTLNQVPKKLLPPENGCVCLYCPNALWRFIKQLGLICYCTVLKEYCWTTSEPNNVILCDGILMGIEQDQTSPSEPQPVPDLDGIPEQREERMRKRQQNAF